LLEEDAVLVDGAVVVDDRDEDIDGAAVVVDAAVVGDELDVVDGLPELAARLPVVEVDGPLVVLLFEVLVPVPIAWPLIGVMPLPMDWPLMMP
jgi:hypothetical protein